MSRIAIAIPCYQEAPTIAKVVGDFRRVLPDAAIFVYDNNSTDGTGELARQAGATVRREKRQGKGFVVASIFEQIDADIIVMVDGDDTYDADAVPLLLAPLQRGDADMAVGTRLSDYSDKSFRPMHVFGNRMACGVVNWMFRASISDIFSGYRAFTREAARIIPITARGFDVETELTLQALYRGLVIQEISTRYKNRPEGSFSKLNTVSDGSRVLIKLFMMLKSYKPLTFFGLASLVTLVMGIAVGVGPVMEFVQDRYVNRIPSAILAASLVLLSWLSLGIGLILNSTNLRLLELEKLVRKVGTNFPDHSTR